MSRPQTPVRPKQPSRLGTLFRQHQDVAVESLDRLLQSFAASLLTWFVIAIALALPLVLLLLQQNLQQFGSDVEDATRISLFMTPGVAEERVLRLREELAQREDVLGTDYISPQQALIEFEQMSGFGEALSGLDENPLPAVIVLTPALAGSAALENLLQVLAAVPEVDDLQYDLAWMERLQGILDLARRLTVMLGVLLCIGVALVVGNTVRMAIENRREEIVVVKLVGGTDAYVSRPFLYTGFWYGVGGGILACLLLWLAQFGLRGPVARLAGMYDGSFVLLGLGLADALLVVLASGLLGWIGAWLSVIRHLREIEPR